MDDKALFAIPCGLYVTVPVTENFRLHQGPMVHNSKDCSDALAGVAFGLYKRREIWGLHGVKTVIIRDGPKMSSDTMHGKGVEVHE